MEEGGFEPPKASPADLQSVPFGHSGTPPYSVSGAGGRIRTPDLLITNRFRYKNPGISKAFRPFSLRNQQLVTAVPSTVSTRKFRPVGQLVGQPTFRAESGLDDSDKSLERGTKKAFRGQHSNSERRKSQAFNIWTAISKESLFSLPYTINQPEYFKFCGGPPAIFGRGIVLTRRKATSIKPFQTTFSARGFSVLPKQFLSTFPPLCGIVCCQV